MIPPAVFLALVAAVAVLAPLLAPHDPTGQSLRTRLLPPGLGLGGNPAYPLGTDHLGRDVLSRIMVGSQASLLVGLGGIAVGATLGSLIGLVAGYRGGWLDESLMTLGDIQLAFPLILLAMAVIAVLGPSLPNLILVTGLSGWATYARVVRAVVLRLRVEEFVQAVRALGGTPTRIVFRHLLPNCLPVLIVLATLDLARIIILESTLSFLGLGIQPPTPSWGGMIAEGRGYLDSAWWIVVLPSLALLLTTLSISRLGDWLRDRLDPTRRSG